MATNIFRKALDWLDAPIFGEKKITPLKQDDEEITNFIGGPGLTPNVLKKVKSLSTGAPLPNHRISLPPIRTGINEVLAYLGNEYRVVSPQFNREIIPLIRNLCMVNPDVSQSLHNVITLGNTGHIVKFDKSVSDDQVAAMKDHLENKHKDWASGLAGMNGMVNRMFSQIMISGALSNEWVPNATLTSVESLIMVDPENIMFVLDNRKTTYQPFQRILNGIIPFTEEGGLLNLIPLNTNTYKYFALNGDGEVPYGFPPYMSALEAIDTQTNMNNNINYLISQLGILGFLEVLLTLPDQGEDETEDDYNARLQTLIDTAKQRVTSNLKDGITVGFKEQHEFKFNSFAREFGNVVELYKSNELQVASGLHQDALLWGRDYNSSEAQIGVIFMKMLSELKNVQNVVKENLEFGYALELRLAGFNFKYLKVEFNRSTIQDDLKFQQALEIKVRNLTQLYLLGTIDTQEIANQCNYDSPDLLIPRVSDDILAGMKPQVVGNVDGKATGDAEKDTKNKSAKKSRSTAKPQGSKK